MKTSKLPQKRICCSQERYSHRRTEKCPVPILVLALTVCLTLMLAGCTRIQKFTSEINGSSTPVPTATEVPGENAGDKSESNPEAPEGKNGDISADNSGDTADNRTPGADEENAEDADGKNQSEPKDNGVQYVPAAAPFYTNLVSFSEGNHFISQTAEVAIRCDTASKCAIYYTLDGSVPDTSSQLYTEPLTFEAAEDGSVEIYDLRAVAVWEDGTVSKVKTMSYFVGADVLDRFSTTIIELTGDPEVFSSEYPGIFSQRVRYVHGRNTEREVYATALNSDGSVIFEQACGVRLIGGDSRSYPCPSLKLYARKEYSPNTGYFNFNLFGTPCLDSTDKIMNKYSKLTLRINGDDSQVAMLRDVLAHRLAKEADFENYEGAVPAVVFLNGEYYNLVWIRESYSSKYFKRKYGVDSGQFSILEETERSKHSNSSSDEIEVKSAGEFNRLYSKYGYADLTDAEVYAELCELVDVEDYLRYYAFETYVCNTDWPNNNLLAYRYYAESEDGYGEGALDGRWRFLIHDFDYSSGIYDAQGGNGASRNLWKSVTDPESARYAPMFTHLMQRENCRKYFADYIAYLADDVLSGENVRRIIDELCGSREEELPYFFDYLQTLKARYAAGEFDYAIVLNRGQLDANVEKLAQFYDKRGEYAKQYVNELWGE